MSRRASRFTVALLLSLFAGRLAAAEPQIAFVPASPRPGEAVFMTFHPEKELLRAACSWCGESYRFLQGADTYGLTLPVPMTEKPGERRATVYWKYRDGEMGKATLEFDIAPRKFGVQHLKLSRTQEQTYSAPETERERKLIGAALDRVTAERHWRGSFILPVEGRVSTEYGLQRYVSKRLTYRHRGVDIAAPEGTPVRAAGAGVVSLADASFVLHGQTVILDHGQGVATLYIHLSAIEVGEGDSVQQGQIIGGVGATGVATGPHLHFAVYAYHEALDPFFWTQLPTG